MYKLLLAIIIEGLFNNLSAQTTISGVVRDEHEKPLSGASISLQDSYDGTTSAEDGTFSFTTLEKGEKKIKITIMGYQNLEWLVTINPPSLILNPVLKEAVTELKAVTITAGAFEASDRKRATVLRPLDIITTPGAQYDIIGALKTLPGVQQNHNADGLFVRGGTGNEARVFIDGILVSNPFYSSVPDIGQRARFSPLLFKGTIFSSGGYSAQYGQGLSSALILETQDLPSRSEANIMISSAQISLTGQKLSKSKKQSAGLTVNYLNLDPYFRVVKQRINYTKPYETVNAEINARKITGNNGILKLYGYVNYNTVALSRPSLDYTGFDHHFGVVNNNVFTIASYQGKISEKLKLNSAFSFSYNKDKIEGFDSDGVMRFHNFLPEMRSYNSQGKVVLTRKFSGLSRLYFGTEYHKQVDKIVAPDSIPPISITDNFLSVFVEGDIYVTSKFVSRVGIRFENSSLLGDLAIAPRISLAYKLDDKSQLSFAYGDYYQKPENRFLFRSIDLNFSKATHYILNYQKISNNKTLRIEAFYKKYKKLLTFYESNSNILKNDGNGYSKGIEIFWRDKTTFKNFDYWIAYSFLDTKRKFLDYPLKIQPDFAAKHTATVVVKRFVSKISTSMGLTYTYASGRPYYNPNRPVKEFMIDRTIDFHNVGFSANYLTMLGKANAVFMINISNVLGTYQVYGYNYSTTRTAEGVFNRAPIIPASKRFIFLGAYISIGADRRQQIIDN